MHLLSIMKGKKTWTKDQIEPNQKGGSSKKKGDSRPLPEVKLNSEDRNRREGPFRKGGKIVQRDRDP